ncbi:MAG: hypothetical protein RBU25_14465 [Lentisphaeria bacterium]|jgi:hypothetical protein|nr:hypothetical protein [Lentisphaeria bacterium]
MLYIIREYLTMVLEWLMGKAHFFAGETAEADIALDPFVLIALVLLATLAMISGFWAGSIAASRRHAMWLHILLGMALPFAYPVAILFTLDLHGAKEREQAKREKEETAKAEQAERERVAQLAGRQAKEEAANAPVSYDRDYFKKIARDESGQLTGPWLIRYKDHNICALHIVDCLDEVLVVEIETPGGDRQRIRVRYVLIESCEKA